MGGMDLPFPEMGKSAGEAGFGVGQGGRGDQDLGFGLTVGDVC